LYLKNGTTYRFGIGAPLSSIQDRDLNYVQVQRNGSSDVSELLSSNGRYVKFYYNDTTNPHQVTSLVDNASRTVSYTYDSSHRMTSMTDQTNAKSTMTWGAAANNLGDLMSVTDAVGNVAQATYDSSFRVGSLSANSGSTSYAYTLVGGNISACDITNPLGFKEHVLYNSAGYVTSDTRAVGQPEQQVTTYTRLAGSNLITDVVDALNRDTHLVYDSLGNVLSVTRLFNTSGAVTTSSTYGATFFLPTSVTDPLGHKTTFSYDTSGDLTTVTDPVGNASTATYNSAGQTLTSTDPIGNKVSYSYSPAADLASLTDPLGSPTTFSYDSVGHLISMRDQLRNTTTFAYDGDDRLIQTVDPKGGVTSNAYDAIGRLSKLTDANSHSTLYAYSQPNVSTISIQMCDAAFACEADYFDLLGNMTSIGDAAGQTTSYRYDGLNRMTATGFNTSSDYKTFVWDAGNRLTQAVDSVIGNFSRNYDLLDRLTSDTGPFGTVNYAFDNAGRRTSMTASNQSAVSYTYDADNRPTVIAQGTAQVSVAYDKASRRTTLTLPNQVTTTYGYDADSNITSLTYAHGSTMLGTLTYGYNERRERRRVRDTFARVNLPASSSATLFTNNQLNTWNGVAAAVDRNYNIVGDPATGLSDYVDERHEMATATSPGGHPTYTYYYDPFGRRMSYVVNGTSYALKYLSDGNNVVQEQSPTGNTNLFTGLNTDEIFSRNDGVSTMYFLRDAMGSTIALTDASGNLSTQYTYEPFGKASASGPASSNEFQWLGRENDPTGLTYLRARYYNPTLQRFMSQDPLRSGGGDVNLFAYAHNNPTTFSDPSGMYGIVGGIGGLGSVSGGIGEDPLWNVIGGVNALFGLSGSVEGGFNIDLTPLLGLAFVGGGGGSNGTSPIGPSSGPPPIGGGDPNGSIVLAGSPSGPPVSPVSPDCSFYGKACAQCGPIDTYDCEAAPFVCRGAGNGVWANCMRACLQDARAKGIKQLGACASILLVPGDHARCLAKCL
jgi:RHS repeat-associated protein